MLYFVKIILKEYIGYIEYHSMVKRADWKFIVWKIKAYQYSQEENLSKVVYNEILYVLIALVELNDLIKPGARPLLHNIQLTNMLLSRKNQPV